MGIPPGPPSYEKANAVIFFFFFLPGRILNKSQTVQERLSAAPVGLEIRTYTHVSLKKRGVGAGCVSGDYGISAV